MKYTKSKIALGIGALILFLVLSYVAMNASYFFKQLRFMTGSSKTDQSTAQQNTAKMEPNYLTIPGLDIKAPIVEAEAQNEKSYQEALKKGVVHYPGTAKPGEVGNVYIFGHSSDLTFKGGDYKTVFALLPRIEKGAEINISDSEGNLYIYIVSESFVANSTDVKLLDQNTNGEKKLTLQTSYPIGTALKRWIVIAKLKE